MEKIRKINDVVEKPSIEASNKWTPVQQAQYPTIINTLKTNVKRQIFPRDLSKPSDTQEVEPCFDCLRNDTRPCCGDNEATNEHSRRFNHLKGKLYKEMVEREKLHKEEVKHKPHKACTYKSTGKSRDNGDDDTSGKVTRGTWIQPFQSGAKIPTTHNKCTNYCIKIFKDKRESDDNPKKEVYEKIEESVFSDNISQTDPVCTGEGRKNVASKRQPKCPMFVPSFSVMDELFDKVGNGEVGSTRNEDAPLHSERGIECSRKPMAPRNNRFSKQQLLDFCSLIGNEDDKFNMAQPEKEGTFEPYKTSSERKKSRKEDIIETNGS